MSRAWQSLSPTVQATLLCLWPWRSSLRCRYLSALRTRGRFFRRRVLSQLLAVVLLAPWLARVGWDGLRVRRWSLVVSRSLFNVAGMAAGFTAITLIPLAQATALGFTAPLWTTLGAVLILGEVIRARRIAALVVGFIGVLVVLRPGFETLSTGALLALSNAFLLAITTLIVKRLTETERPEAIVAWMVILQSPLSLIPAAFVWTWPSPLTWVGCSAWPAQAPSATCWTRAVRRRSQPASAT